MFLVSVEGVQSRRGEDDRLCVRIGQRPANQSLEAGQGQFREANKQ